MEFQEYMKQGKEVFTPYIQEELASIPLETLYTLDIKQFGIEESSVNQKAVEKDPILQYRVKSIEGALENPIYNFFRFRIWPRFNCDKADVSKQYYEETYGWDYDNRTLLNKDTAYSFLGIYKTLLLHMDVLDVFTSSQTEDINVKNIFFYQNYAKYEGKDERFGWMSKAKALLALCKHLHIHPDEVAAFGDSNNDDEMLASVKYGVAMDNALPQTKASASYVTKTNDEDGIVHFLNQIR